MSLIEKIQTLPQYLWPQHTLSRLVAYLAECQCSLIKNFLIKGFIKLYHVDMSQALQPDPKAYRNFNDFFTRHLKPELRPINHLSETIVSSADGTISQLGDIEDEKIFQAKGHSFNLTQLLGGNPAHAELFKAGKFMTVYLSPKDYHRVHMPVTGRLKEMVYIPGKLFSVNERTVRNVDNLFARNERVVCLFDTAVGPMAVILVGAMIVASISTTWAGTITPPHRQSIETWQYDEDSIFLEKGDALGQFKLGSTSIVLFAKDTVQWLEAMQAGTEVKMGEIVGNILTN